MDDLARAEYPAMLPHLQPNQAAQLLNDRVKRIGKINNEIADWLQERRRIEDQYVAGLRKLAQFRVPNAQSELGVFQTPWARILGAVERIAASHHQFADGIERDVELPLRAFPQRNDVQNMQTISSNLTNLGKDLEDARDKADKLNKKGGKTSAQKIDAASMRLESAQQEWDSQAPFVFETLQALDESRVNQLRDALTQYQTHESDQAQRTQTIAGETLAVTIEIETESEIRGFVQGTIGDRPLAPTRSSTRRSSVGVGANNASQAPGTPAAVSRENTMNNNITPTPSVPQSVPEEDSFDQSPAPQKESKLRRLGTILGGRRRQSVHGGFGQLGSQKGGATNFGRLGSSGRGISPRASASNLNESTRLSSLAEDGPASPIRPKTGGDRPNGLTNIDDDAPALPIPTGTNGSLAGHFESSQASTGEASSPKKDAEGFSVRAPMHDPISEAQREAASDDSEQPFKLSIQNQPISEEDPDEKEAALSSVANTLKLPTAQRSRTVRGRRDVRNTIYNPAGGLPDALSDSSLASLPTPKPTTLGSTLTSEPSIAGVSDSQSVRSGTSLGNFAHIKHPEMSSPGLNSSIIETVSAQFEEGEIKNVAIAGEIAFAYNSNDSNDKTHETIRINNFARLEKIGPNRIFVQNASIEHPDQFSLELSHIPRTATAFSYRVFADEGNPLALSDFVPLLLKPAWKPQGDKLGLLLQYRRNPACALPTGPLTLHNVVIVATYDGRAVGAQTKPSGTHLKDRHLVYWRLGDVVLPEAGSDEAATAAAHKIVCRVLGAEGAEPRPGRVEARWEFVTSGPVATASGISVARLTEAKGKEVAASAAASDPFADADAAPDTPNSCWVDVPLTQKLVSGKYESN
ncbi:Fes/CIP4 domain-containing protein [Cordyceps fumosorosea ARSEF 2679]|uniref:Fes/CIP4 domain-containing protein n=1 Tax=Cordyceps fumosorosea (strain ARSEF 2679) TaxID=1081104 RepID=A0A167RKY5_CORFA|nr:Fes/CIP4 domain-containing protein [Cordyceps fumosorosea ARSEF 2679]OAA58696.1 Fes/CIP4 domain-containing protein [Cordyceps fumosorosea ARSEF 2679]